MKASIRTISAILLLLGICSVAFGQRYEPREGWPYLFKEFTSGELRTSGGKVLAEGHYNICVTDGALHYINDGKVMKADLRTVYSVAIGSQLENRFFLNRAGEMVEVIGQEGPVYLFKRERLDRLKYEKQDIGYGVSSATASKQKTTSVAMGGGLALNMELKQIVQNAITGELLPMEEFYSFWFGGQEVEASRKGLLSIDGIDKEAAKAFIKNEKIRWHSEESLLKVAAFIAQQL